MTKSFNCVILIQMIIYAILLVLFQNFFSDKEVLELAPDTLIVILPFLFGYLTDEIYNFFYTFLEENTNKKYLDVLIIKTLNIIISIYLIKKYFDAKLNEKNLEMSINYFDLIIYIVVYIVVAVFVAFIMIRISYFLRKIVFSNDIDEYDINQNTLKSENERLKAQLYSYEKTFKDALITNNKNI